jgi:hypothetical protein
MSNSASLGVLRCFLGFLAVDQSKKVLLHLLSLGQDPPHEKVGEPGFWSTLLLVRKYNLTVMSGSDYLIYFSEINFSGC